MPLDKTLLLRYAHGYHSSVAVLTGEFREIQRLGVVHRALMDRMMPAFRFQRGSLNSPVDGD